MPGDASLQLSFHGSGGAGNLDSDAFLGGARTNALIRHGNSTVSAAAAAGALRLYLTTPSGLFGSSVVYIRDGNAGGFQSRVTEYNAGGAWVDLLDPLPASVAIGDSIWGYTPAYSMMPFKDTTALESANGIVHYSGLYVVNSGASLPDFRLWLEVLNPGPVTHEIAATNDMTHTLVTIPNESTAPDLSGMLQGAGAGRFIRAGSYLAGFPTGMTLTSGQLGFWIKRTGPADAFRVSDQYVAVVGESSNGTYSKLVLHWNTVGFTPIVALTHAPTVYLRGGARFKATVRSTETGLRVPNVPVGFAVTSGPGTISAPPAPGITDENGEILARYAAPTDVGEIGQVATVEAQV